MLFHGKKKRRCHSENHCLIIHVIKSIHTEHLKKNATWDFSEMQVRFITVGYVFDYENLIKLSDDII